MLSKAHIHMLKQLKKISKSLNVMLLTEIKEGSKRYDFYFPTSTPIVIEVDGTNHQQKKADGFFFKSDTSLINYKLNDVERNNFNKRGKIKLFRFTDKEFPTITELFEIFGEETIQILKKGNDIKNAYYQSYSKNQEYNNKRKEQIRARRKETK